MKRLWFVMFALSAFACGQGVSVPPGTALKNVNGTLTPIAGATITVCGGNVSGLPCFPPLASALFLDASLTQPLSNPFTADANGNYSFSIAPGTYTVTVTSSGFAGYSYQVSANGNASGNNVWSGSQNFLGSVTFSGQATFLGTTSFAGNMTASGQNSLTAYNLDNILLVDGNRYACSDAGISTALAAAQNTNGIVDARGCPAMSWTSNPFLGIIKPVTLLLGAVTISTTKTLAIGATARVGPAKILCSGTTFDFEPSGPFLSGINDRAIMFDWSESSSPANQAITGALAVGTSTITSTSTPNPAPVAGQWMEVVEIDTGVNDAVAFAYAQVASVSGSTITLQRPLNVAFSNNTGAGNTFYNVLVNPLPEGDTIEGCRIRSNQAAVGTPGIAVMHVRNALVSNNDIAMANGQDIYSYRSDASSFRGNKLSAVGVNPANSEMAESTNLIVAHNHFVANGIGPVPGLSVDFGSNNFSVTGNTFDGIGGIQLYLYNGAAFGVVSGNTLGYVNGGNGQAIQLQSVLNTTVANNVLAGGSSVGIGISNSVSLAVTLASAGNIVYGNTLGTFSPNYSLTAGSVVAPIDNGFPFTQTIGTGTATSNGTAIATLTSQAQPAITITGATTSDVATCSLNAAPVATWQTGIQFLLPVVTANTVTPWLSNPTAGSITPVATVIRCSVTR